MSNESCGSDSKCLCNQKLIDSLVKCLDCVGTREVQDKEKAQEYLDSYVMKCLLNDVPVDHRTIHVTKMGGHHTSTSTSCTTSSTSSTESSSTPCTTSTTSMHDSSPSSTSCTTTSTKAEYPMYPASSITMYSGTPTGDGNEPPASTDSPDKSEGGESGSQTETSASGESSATSGASLPVSSDGSSTTGSTDSPLASSTSAPPSNDPGNPTSEAAQGNGSLSMHSPMMGIRIVVTLIVVGMSLLMFSLFFGL
ncbi:hypothetical protein PQX77_009336 [Marasmius sp. AFHP31]|nr:hypothetical protein PQX77_009336 [Marasmius sp. AFHP31]